MYGAMTKHIESKYFYAFIVQENRNGVKKMYSLLPLKINFL